MAGKLGDRSSGNLALDGAVLQMMRSVSLPPPPGGSFRATAPVHFEVQRQRTLCRSGPKLC